MITISTVSTAAASVNAFDTGYVTSDGALFAQASVAERAQLINDGRIQTTTQPAVLIKGAYANIVNAGTMSGGGSLGTIDAYSTDAYVGNLSVFNTGTIMTRHGADTAALITRNSGLSLVNLGTMSSTGEAVIQLFDLGTGLRGLNNVITNDGLIDGHGQMAIYSEGPSAELITNGGVIRGWMSLGEGNDVVSNTGIIKGDIDFSLGVARLTNTGTIEGDVKSFGTGVAFTNQGTILGSAYLDATSLRLRHSGTIDAISIDADAANVTISGRVLGDVTSTSSLSSVDWRISGTIGGKLHDNGMANTAYDLRGATIAAGVLDLGGSDLYRLDSAIDISDLGTGLDTVSASCDMELAANIETLELRGLAMRGTGNALDNRITGTGFANLLAGEEGQDSLQGLAGDDQLWGGAGQDTLDGGTGRDLLWGDAGNDRLLGGSQQDRLEGGAGADILSGGADADVFVFVAVADSGLTSATRDTVLDFVSGTDRIDLSAIDAVIGLAGDQGFSWGALAAGSAGRLMLRTEGAVGFLEGDITGDGLADLSIRLNGVSALTLSDLVL